MFGVIKNKKTGKKTFNCTAKTPCFKINSEGSFLFKVIYRYYNKPSVILHVLIESLVYI